MRRRRHREREGGRKGERRKEDEVLLGRLLFHPGHVSEIEDVYELSKRSVPRGDQCIEFNPEEKTGLKI